MEQLRNKWKNFWYYHRVHVLIAAAVAAVCGYLWVQSAATEAPDYHIGIIRSIPWPQETVDALEAQMCALGQDINGDGQVRVQLHAYYVDLADDSANAGVNNSQTVAALDADLIGQVSGLFLTDDPQTLARITNGLFPGAPVFFGEDMYLMIRSDADRSYEALLQQLN